MSKNTLQPAHNGAAQPALKKRRKPDPRAARTRIRLGMAFIQLIHEKPIEDVTVQDVLDRAAVGRSTFYLHFRDKNDLLLSQLEIFCDFQSRVLVESKEKSMRVIARYGDLRAHRNAGRVLSHPRRCGPHQRLLRSRAGRVRAWHQAAPDRLRPAQRNHQTRARRARQCPGRQLVVTAALAARSRRKRITRRDGRALPQDGLDRASVGAQPLGSTEGLQHALLGARRQCIALAIWPVFKGTRHHL